MRGVCTREGIDLFHRYPISVYTYQLEYPANNVVKNSSYVRTYIRRRMFNGQNYEYVFNSSTRYDESRATFAVNSISPLALVNSEMLAL